MLVMKLPRKGWGLPLWEIQEWLVGLRKEGLGYLFAAIFWGKSSVPAERYCVDAGTGVYLH